MFCSKCGNQLLEGAMFCHKCGTKVPEEGDGKEASVPTCKVQKQEESILSEEQQGGAAVMNESCEQEASVQSDISDPSGSIQSQNQVTTVVPKKKKSKKLLIILAVIATFIVILIASEIGGSEKTDGYETQQNTMGVALSQTYRNAKDGICFKYPSAWVLISEDEFVNRYGGSEDYPVVLLANEIEDLPEENSYIMVSRFDVTQEDINHLFIDDEEFAATFDDDVTIEATFVTQIDGVAARKIEYHEKDGISFQSYFYAVDSTLYRIDFNYFGESSGNKQRFFDAIIGSYEITVDGDETVGQVDLPNVEEGAQSKEEIFRFETDYREAYSNKIRELSAMDDAFQFALIDLIGNGVPELVAEHSGYDVSVFAWVDGKIITLMDQWSYGAGGNAGYEYLPENNIIRNYNMDYAGAVIYELYFTVNEACEVVELLDEELSIWYFKDVNGDGEIDEDEYCDEPVYYYGDNEISEDEYASYQVKGDFKTICGKLSAEEMLEQLDED